MLLFFFACLPKSAPVQPVPVVQSPPQTFEERTIDYTSLFNGRNSQSIYVYDLVDTVLMQRVLVEGEILASNLENVAIENWTRKVLFSELIRRNSLIIGPIQDLLGYPDDGELSQIPTASIRNLSFVSSTEEINVIVQQQEDSIVVAMREFDDQESLCSADAMLPVGFVEFNAALQRYSDGAVVAMIQEIVLLPDLDQTVVTETVDVTSVDSLCSSIMDIYLYHEQLSRHSHRYYKAAQRAVELGLGPLYVTAK